MINCCVNKGKDTYSHGKYHINYISENGELFENILHVCNTCFNDNGVSH